MSDQELKDIILMCEKATKSPWISYVEDRDFECGSSFIQTGTKDFRDYDIEFAGIRTEDQDFIAMSRNIIPELVEEIIRLKAILEIKNNVDL